MQRIVLFAGVQDASNLFETTKAATLLTDQHGSLIRPQLLVSRRRLIDFGALLAMINRLDKGEYHRRELPPEFKQLVGDLVARFLALDPYFEPERVVWSVLIPLMRAQPDESFHHGINWTRYHLWLPLLQWLQTYHGLFSTLADPLWLSTMSRTASLRMSINPVLINTWIHLVHSEILLVPSSSSSTTTMNVDEVSHRALHFYLTEMVEILLHTLDWESHVFRLLDRTKPHLHGCCWSSVKLALLKALGKRTLDPERVIHCVGRFQPHLLFDSTDLAHFLGHTRDNHTWLPIWALLSNHRFFTLKATSVTPDPAGFFEEVKTLVSACMRS